jgi:two-component system phosphate regulon sensor histidine kinase PhoR
MDHSFRSSPVRAGLVSVFIIAAPLCVLFGLEWRALDNFETATAQVLRQGSRHLAEHVAARVQRDFKSPAFNLLERVDHNAVRELRLEPIAATLAEVKDEQQLLDTFFVWSTAAPTHRADSLFFFRLREREERLQKTTSGFVQDPALSRIILERSREFADIHANFALAQITVGSRSFEVVYHLLYDLPERRRLLSFLGFMIDTRWVREQYFASLVSSDDVSEQQLFGFSPLLVSILDDEGHEVYQSGRSLLAQYEDEVRFPYLFYDIDIIDSLAPFRPTLRYWRVRTAYVDGDIAGIVRRQTNHQRLLWSIVALVAAAGVTLTARAAIREVRVGEMKSDFVANVSHELKTPLAKIQLFADTLRSGRVKSPDKLQEYAEIISNQAVKLNHQIAGILDFRKIESGRRQYEMEEIDIRAVLSSALAAFDYELHQNGFDVELHVPETEVPVNGNAEGLQRVFENLISNAIKYSDVHHFLNVRLHPMNGQVHVDFTDRGIGIPKREQAKIFRKFYRASQPLSKSVSGSGLGLAIVQQIVTAHGGHVTVTSASGAGSTFAVILPVCDDSGRGRRI